MQQLTEDEGTLPRVENSRRFYRPELDGLRFYAFLGVFICHTLPLETAFYRNLHLPIPWFWTAVVRSGAAGVDLFFVLSAFLITSLLLKERQETGEVSLRLFYIRRILRIWPLYFLVVGLGVLIAAVPDRGHFWYYDPRLPWEYVAGYLLFSANWIYIFLGLTHSICAPLWTVSIEEQFYIVWPALARVLKRRGLFIAGVVVLIVATVSQVERVLAKSSAGYVYYGSAPRCTSLVLGIFMALLVDRLPRITAGTRFLLIFAGLAGWIVASTNDSDFNGPASLRMVLDRAIISLAAGAILYGCLYSRSKLVTGNWVVQLGKISYGLYMLHSLGLLLALSVFHPVRGRQLLATKAISFVVTLVLAFASYRWIESPFLRLKNRFAPVLSRPI